jgi:copper chaperone NosL
VNNFFRREYRFLRRTLNLRSRLLLVAAAIVIVTAVFFPLWQIRLVAPQYQEGLSLEIYPHKLVGGNHGQDLAEINTLNHYIGMKHLAEADFVEMKWLPFAFGIFALLALRAAAIGRMVSLIDLGVLFLYFGAFSIGNFYFRLYTYGHQLDPHAPMTIKAFTPILLGSQQIANFVQTSLPQSGALLLTLFPALIASAVWSSRKDAS